MKEINRLFTRVIKRGVAVQMVLADQEGLVLHNVGDVFDGELLVASFMSIQRTFDVLSDALDSGPISEMVVGLDEKTMTISCHRFPTDLGIYIIISVVPFRSNYRLFTERIIKEFQEMSKT